jgi:FkbM family methyltransferase
VPGVPLPVRSSFGRARRRITVGLRSWLDRGSAFAGRPTAPALEAQLRRSNEELERLRAELDETVALLGAAPGDGDFGRIEMVLTDVGPMMFPAWDEFLLPVFRNGQTWEPQEAAWLAARVATGDTVVDVGANAGYHALRLARLVGPSGKVLAIEPEPMNFALLQANLALNGIRNVEAVQAAAGDRPGTAQLVRSTNNPGDHRLFEHAELPVRDTVTVRVECLDDLVDDADLLVIDTQGFDHRVLAGATRLIARRRPAVMTEFWTQGLEGLGDDPREVLAGYSALGYRIEILEAPDLGLDPSPDQIIDTADATAGRYVTLILTARTDDQPS